MSMPQHFNIAVIAEDHGTGSDTAAAAAGILRSLHKSGYAPYYVACSTYNSSVILKQYRTTHGIIMAQPVKPYLLNASRIDLWLALDPQGEETAWCAIKQTGPAPNSYYRHAFPEPVALCKVGAQVPAAWSEDRCNQWIDLLARDLLPWAKKIWDAFCESS